MKRYLILLATFVAYIAAAEIGSIIHAVVGYSPTIWPPAGIAVAGILFGQNLATTAIFVAATLVNINLGLSWTVAILAAMGSTFSAWLAAFAIKRRSTFDWGFGQPRDVIYFFFAAVMASPLIGAAVCSLALNHANILNSSDIPQFFYSFWVGDGLGILMVVPVAMIWSTVPARVTVLARFWEFAALILTTIVVATLIFINFSAIDQSQHFIYRRLYFVFPVLIWSALRFGPLGLSTVMLIASASASYGATHELWLFQSNRIPEGLFTAQAFIGISSLSGLVLAAVVRNIRLNEEKFRSMFEGSDVPMAEVDMRGQFIQVNDRFCSLTEYTREELLAKTFPELTHPDDIEHEAELFRKLLSKELSVLKVEKRYITKRGDVIWITVDATLINHGPGRDPTAIAVVYDITQRKTAENNATKAQYEATEANKSKSDFLATMSHEIRTPLGVILGFSELLQDQSLDNNLRVEFAQTIRRNSIELGTLVDDLLDLSKIEAGRLELASGEINIHDLCNDICALFRATSIEKGIRLTSHIDSSVPSQFHSDSKRLRQILTNVVSNAINYTERGSIDINVSMNTSNTFSKLTIAVVDTGRGIETDDIEHLFQPFRKPKQARNRHKIGSGLGLTLSRRLAQLLGGDVVLKETKRGVGSTFEISVIIDVKPQDAPIGASDQSVARPTSVERGKLDHMKILVAEDTPDQAMLITLLLTDLGASVDVAKDGAEALEKITKKDYSLVLMDMQMPVITGYEATTALRKRGCQLPILALTAQAMRSDKTRCFESGCNGHLSKPFTQESLLAAISECMKSTRT